MKILRISLRNLASLAGTHTVDFTREPLRSTGLFSISGPTGSGKSTLLDALCLALYEKTPRLAAATGEQIPDGAAKSTLTQRDPGNLLRRGSTEGFAEVAFLGVDGLSYTARWSIKRAHNRADGNLQSPTMVLLSGDVPYPANTPVVEGGKKTVVLDKIAEKVGLTFPQFTRAVLLAQNDFAVFLKSNDADRATILEALTGTERFATLSRLIFNRYKSEREAVTALENQLAGAAPLSTEARALAETELLDAATVLRTAEAALTSLDHQLRWFDQDHALAARANQSAEAVTTARAALDAAAPREADLSLTERLLHTLRPLHDAELLASRHLAATQAASAQAAQRLTESGATLTSRRAAHTAAHTAAEAAQRLLAEAQPALSQARLLDSQIDALAPRLRDATHTRATAEAGRATADQAFQALRRQLSDHETNLTTLSLRQNDLAPYAPFVDDVAAWRDRLTATATARSALATCIRDSDTTARRVDRLRADLEKTSLNLAALETQYNAATTAHQAAEKSARAFDPEALAVHRRSLDSQQASLNAYQAHFSRLTGLTERHQATTTEITRLTSEHAEHTRALDELNRTRIPSATAAFTASQSALKLLEAAADRTVPRLRATLLPDQPCPVCGSHHHPLAAAAHDPEPVALADLRKQATRHQTELDELRDALTRHQTALDLTAKTQAERQNSAGQIATELATLRASIPSDPACAPLLALPETAQPAALAPALAALTQARTAHEQQEAAQRAAAAALTAATAKLDAARTAHTQAAQTLTTQKAELSTAEAALTSATTQRTQTEQDFASRLSGLAPLLQALPKAASAFEKDAPAFVLSFTTQVEALRKLREQIATLTTLRAQDQARLPGREEALATATQTLTTASGTETALREEHTRLQTERQSLFNGRAVATVQAEFESAVHTAKTTLETRARELTEAEKAQAAATEAATAQKHALEAATTAHATARSGLDQALASFTQSNGHPFDRTALVPYLARDTAWLSGERHALAALRDTLQSAAGQHQAHAAALAAHRAQAPTTEPEATVRSSHADRTTELTTAKQRQVSAAAAVSADDQRRRDAAALLQTIEERRARATPWGRLDELLGSADGAKFRSIVQRHALDILLGYANAQLDLISARYRIERLPDSLNLMVCDRDMGDERRSVHSLSGGESFLVSLALALGLASLTSNRLRIESLFIDEGFGSLDPATLDTAMNALMQLESQGRKVGVISHVTEMAEAIPVQIRVVKGQGGASRLQVPGAAPSAPEEESPPPATKTVKPKTDIPDEAIAEISARLLGLLQREKAACRTPVSLTSLRKELGCDANIFTAARTALGDQVITVGRSLDLA